MKRATISTIAGAIIAGAFFASGAAAGPHDALIAKHAAANGVPEALVRRVIRIESRGNPRIVNKGNYGLMQIRLGTARAMGYAGTAEGLLDPETNLTYAVKYLAGAYRTAGCNADRAVSYYQRGYYKAAKSKCSLRQPSPTQVAQSETKALAKTGADAAAAPSTDVIKPKVVPIEAISKSTSAQVPVPKSAKFEPVRISTPPAPETGSNGKPVQPNAGPEPAAISTVARIEPGPVPLPRARPGFGAASKSNVQPAHRSGRRHGHAGTKAKTEKSASLLSTLKKLVAPDKKTSRRPQQIQAQSQAF